MCTVLSYFLQIELLHRDRTIAELEHFRESAQTFETESNLRFDGSEWHTRKRSACYPIRACHHAWNII